MTEPVLDLPTDFPRPPVPGTRHTTVRRVLDADLARAAGALAAAEGVPPAAVPLAALAVVLRRHTGQREIVVGTPGPLVLDVPGGLTGTALLRAIATTTPGVPGEPPCRVLFGHPPRPGVDLSVSSHGGELCCAYRTDLFTEARITRFLGHLNRVLTALVTAPGTPVGDLPMLTDEEHRRAAHDWNATGADYPSQATLPALVAAQAAATPGAVAVRTPEGTLTYRELDRRVAALAGRLHAAGVRAGEVVGVVAERTPDLPVALLAVGRAGAGYLPLDPAHPADRLRFLVTDTGAPVVLASARAAARLPALPARTVLLDGTGHQGGGADRSGPDGLCYVIYTSGSTGAPKGVLLDQRGRVNNFTDFNRRFGLGPGDGVLAVSSVGFDMTAYDVFGPLLAGATLVLPEQGWERDPAHWLDLLTAGHVTVWHSVPALLDLLLFAAEELGVRQLPRLRLVLLGGDWIPVGLPDRLRALAPGAQVVSLGGATEASMDSTVYPIGAVDPGWRSIPYGTPMANQRAYIRDVDGWLAPVGVPGELYLGGAGLAWGYHGAAARSAEKFVPDPFGTEPGARIYATGDLARYRADGVLELLGRLDFQVKIGGNRVELGEVEAALRAVPGVAGAVVAAATVRGGRALVGYVVPEDGQALAPARLRARLGEQLPAYMVPAAFVQLDRIPLTPNGKVDRGRLPAP